MPTLCLSTLVVALASPVLRGFARDEVATAPEQQSTTDAQKLPNADQSMAHLRQNTLTPALDATTVPPYPVPNVCAKSKKNKYGSECMCEDCCVDPRYPKACNGRADMTMGTCSCCALDELCAALPEFLERPGFLDSGDRWQQMACQRAPSSGVRDLLIHAYESHEVNGLRQEGGYHLFTCSDIPMSKAEQHGSLWR
jgi:hypothetical protein